MSKRLEEIKALQLIIDKGDWDIQDGDDVKWLIEQAEKVEELARELSNWQDLHKADTIKLDNQNRRLRESIKISIHELFVRNAYENDEAINEVTKILSEALESEIE